jgi:hypothetical protein
MESVMPAPKNDEQYSLEEIAIRADALLLRLLKTPPQPRKGSKKKSRLVKGVARKTAKLD